MRGGVCDVDGDCIGSRHWWLWNISARAPFFVDSVTLTAKYLMVVCCQQVE